MVAPYVISPLQGISDRLTPASPMKVTASTFSASNSVGTETTSDTGGGQDVGYINNSSWLEYPDVNFGSGDFVNVNWFSFGAGPGISARYAQGATASGQMPALSAGSLMPAQGGGQGL